MHIEEKTARTLANITKEEWEAILIIARAKLEETEPKKVKNIKQDISQEDKKVNEFVRKLGIPLHYKGYRYLCSAIIYYMNAENPMDILLTLELYPTVAEEFNTTPQRVERAIRYAIVKAYERGDMKKIFKHRPSASEAIATFGEYLKTH